MQVNFEGKKVQTCNACGKDLSNSNHRMWDYVSKEAQKAGHAILYCNFFCYLDRNKLKKV